VYETQNSAQQSLVKLTKISTLAREPRNRKLPVINLNNTLGYSSIQKAIDCRDTNVGDTIYVKAGIYQENIFIQKAVTLLGENKLTTIIDGDNNGSTVRIGVPNVVVQNFTITNGNGNASFLQTGNTSYVLKRCWKTWGRIYLFVHMTPLTCKSVAFLCLQTVSHACTQLLLRRYY
jgi:pectin methylesterase-like acyl-CoA thioesterase